MGVEREKAPAPGKAVVQPGSQKPAPRPDDRFARAVGNSALSTVLTNSVGEFFADGLTHDELRGQVAMLVEALERGTPDPVARQVMRQNLEVLQEYGARHGIELPAATAHEFRRVLAVHAADLRRQLDTIRQADRAWRDSDGVKLATPFEWHVDQLDWVVDATRRAATLVDEAERDGTASAQKFAAAGAELSTAIFALRAVAVVLAYDNFREEATQYPGGDLSIKGARMAHEILDPVLFRLRYRLPGAVDSAVEQLTGYNDFGFDFRSMQYDVEENIKARARFLGWLNVAMLALTAFEIWLLPVAGGGAGKPPRFGGFGGAGGTAAVTATGTAVASVEATAALQWLATVGAISSPKLVKLIGGRPGGIQAPPKPIQSSTGGGGSGKPDYRKMPLEDLRRLAKKDPDAAFELGKIEAAAELEFNPVARGIAEGHAKKHHFPATALDDLTKLVEEIMHNPTAKKVDGTRTAYWDDKSKTIVIRNPRDPDGGTVFRPDDGRAYFDRWPKTR